MHSLLRALFFNFVIVRVYIVLELLELEKGEGKK
jgi:hypothetical protein